MKGDGSNGLKTTSTMLSATQKTTMTVWMMMNRQEPIAPTTVSAIRSPAVLGLWMMDRLWLTLMNHPFHRDMLPEAGLLGRNEAVRLGWSRLTGLSCWLLRPVRLLPGQADMAHGGRPHKLDALVGARTLEVVKEALTGTQQDPHD